MKCTIKIEFSYMEINILFYLKILNKVAKDPPLSTATFSKEGSKSNFFR